MSIKAAKAADVPLIVAFTKSDKEAADAIHDVSTGRHYSFLVNAYKVKPPTTRIRRWPDISVAAAAAALPQSLIVPGEPAAPPTSGPPRPPS